MSTPILPLEPVSWSKAVVGTQACKARSGVIHSNVSVMPHPNMIRKCFFCGVGTGCSSALLKRIFTGMLEGALKKCVDPYFPPLEGQSLSDMEDVEGSGDWVLVYPRDDKKGKKGGGDD